MPVSGCHASQAMGLITVNDDRVETVATVKTDSVKSKQDYVVQYLMVFDSPVGTPDGPGDIPLDANVVSTALPARPVPVSLRELVKTELERLHRLNVMESVKDGDSAEEKWVSYVLTHVY